MTTDTPDRPERQPEGLPMPPISDGITLAQQFELTVLWKKITTAPMKQEDYTRMIFDLYQRFLALQNLSVQTLKKRL